ncbi:MAG: hypothetical protein AAFY88_14850 [Acidobacteriota bacterium]
MAKSNGDHIPQRYTQVTVDFNPNRRQMFQFEGDSVVRDPIRHPEVRIGIESGSGINMIVFVLESSNPDAVFAGEAFQWVTGRGEGARAAPTPPGIVIQNHTDKRILLQNFNSTDFGPDGETELFDFHLLVLCGGTMYASPDPTIINQTSPDPPPGR